MCLCVEGAPAGVCVCVCSVNHVNPFRHFKESQGFTEKVSAGLITLARKNEIRVSLKISD